MSVDEFSAQLAVAAALIAFALFAMAFGSAVGLLIIGG